MTGLTLEERKARAVELRGQGWTYREIAEDVGVSHTAVRSYLVQAGLAPAPPHTPETAHAAITHLMERPNPNPSPGAQIGSSSLARVSSWIFELVCSLGMEPVDWFQAAVEALRDRRLAVAVLAVRLAWREGQQDSEVPHWEDTLKILLNVVGLFDKQGVPPEVVVGALGEDWPEVTVGLIEEVRSGFVSQHVSPILDFTGWSPRNRAFFGRLCYKVKDSTDPLNWTPENPSRRDYGHWRSRDELDALIEETSQTLDRLQALRDSRPDPEKDSPDPYKGA